MKEESISQYYEKDHDRLDGLFQDYRRLKGGDFLRAKESFLQFELGLHRHIAWEEDILFPLFEQKTGLHEHGPTAVMKMEHQQIRQLMDAMKQKVLQGNPHTSREEEQLLMTLGSHNLKEENVLYPMIDHHVDAQERHEVFEKMDRMPESRYCADCTPVK